MPLSKLDYELQQARLVGDEPIVGERRSVPTRPVNPQYAALVQRLKDLSIELAHRAIDASSLKDILGVHSHWTGERAERVKAMCRELLSGIEADCEPVRQEIEDVRHKLRTIQP